MILTDEIQSALIGFNAIWVVGHFIYFSFYYSKYSACFHKLNSVNSLEKTQVYEQALIDVTRSNTWNKIKKLRRISFFPPCGILGLHLLVFYLFWENEIFHQYYYVCFYIFIGALGFIFLANKTQGARVLRGKNGPFFRGPY